jgi:uncharacterized protein (DUF2235 family)
MNRRTLLKNLVIIAGGITLIPGCVGNESKSNQTGWKNFSLSTTDENDFAELMEALLPETETPGSKTLGVHLFVLKMVDDCHSIADHNRFVEGFKSIQQQAKSQFSQKIEQLTLADKQQLLKQAAQADKESDMHRFYQIARHRAIQGYLNSKYVMDSITHYKLIPGKYDGFYPVEQA